LLSSQWPMFRFMYLSLIASEILIPSSWLLAPEVHCRLIITIISWFPI
jgi:hypothetical protein